MVTCQMSDYCGPPAPMTAAGTSLAWKERTGHYHPRSDIPFCHPQLRTKLLEDFINI